MIREISVGEKSDNFKLCTPLRELHTPCTMGFTLQFQELKSFVESFYLIIVFLFIELSLFI